MYWLVVCLYSSTLFLQHRPVEIQQPRPRHCQHSTDRAVWQNEWLEISEMWDKKGGESGRVLKCCEVALLKNYWPISVRAAVLHNQHQLKSAYQAPRLSSISFTTSLNHHLSPPPSARITSHRRCGRSGFTLQFIVRLFFNTTGDASSS